MVTEKQSYPRCSTTLWTVTKWKAATPAPGPAHAISPRPGEATTIQKITQRDTAAQDSGTATKKSLGNRGTCSDRFILQRLRPDPAPPRHASLDMISDWLKAGREEPGQSEAGSAQALFTASHNHQPVSSDNLAGPSGSRRLSGSWRQRTDDVIPGRPLTFAAGSGTQAQ